MGIRVGLEMLAILLILTPLVSNGMVMPKCEVVDHLMSNIPADIPGHDKLVAQIACYAEVASHFDTSLINQAPPPGLPGSRKTRAARQNQKPPKATNPPSKLITTSPPKTTKPPANPTTNPPPRTTNYPHGTTNTPPRTTNYPHGTTNTPPRTTNYPLGTTNPPANPTTHYPPPSQTTLNPNAQATTLPPNIRDPLEPMINETEPPMPPQTNYSNPDEMFPPPPPMTPRNRRDISGPWTLYGMFQLANRVACTSPTKGSLNVCDLSCDKLIDDDITDDIQCVLDIMNSKPDINAKPGPSQRDNKLIQSLNSVIQNSCPNLDYTQYLAECSNQ